MLPKDDDNPLEHAARLLVTASALGDLSLTDARYVLRHMRPGRIKAHTILIHEGEQSFNSYMMLILRGEVSVENAMPGMHTNIVIDVIGAGSIIGEMSMFDGGPRAATCTAVTDLAVAVLSRSSLKRLLHERPEVGVRFMLAVSKRMSDRLREVNKKLKMYVSLTNTLQQEVNALMDGKSSASVNRR